MIYFQKHVDDLKAAHQGEIQTLKAYISILEAKLNAEGKRADAAIDQLLIKGNSGPVSPQPERQENLEEKITPSVSAFLASIGGETGGE